MNGEKEQIFSDLEIYQATVTTAKTTLLEMPLNIKGRHIFLCVVKNLDGAATLTLEVGIFHQGTFRPCFQKKALAGGDVNTFAREFHLPPGAKIYINALSSAGTITGNIHINGHETVPIKSEI